MIIFCGARVSLLLQPSFLPEEGEVQIRIESDAVDHRQGGNKGKNSTYSTYCQLQRKTIQRKGSRQARIPGAAGRKK